MSRAATDRVAAPNSTGIRFWRRDGNPDELSSIFHTRVCILLQLFLYTLRHHRSHVQAQSVMGRLDLRPARVRQTVSLLLDAKRSSAPPPWYQAIGLVPPPEVLSRTVPIRHHPPPLKGRRNVRRPSKMFRPQQISYEEDTLRSEFFKDHPWELARPRLILEDDGKDYQRWDWSKPFQAGRPVGGER